MYHHPVTGRRVTAPNTFAAKGDATRWLATIETDLARGDLPDPNQDRVRFGEFAGIWLAAKTDVRESTQELYEYQLRRHILPYFADVAVGRIDAATIRSWHAELIASSGMSKTSVAKVYRLMRQILAAAVDDRLLRENPCRVAGAATERSAEREIPDLATVAVIHDAMDPRYAALVSLAAFVGLRRGECLGLTRAHLDLDSHPATVLVDRQVAHLRRGPAIHEPKTLAGRRRLALPDLVADELRAHLDTHIDDQAADGLVFPAPTGGVISKGSWRRIWERARRDADYTGTFHDLRHVAGTLNAAAGATLKEAMARLGHASPQAALRYQHAHQRRDTEVAQAINDLIKPSETNHD